MTDNAKKTSTLLQPSQTGLGNLLSKVKEWEVVNGFLATIIEPKLWKYCHVGGLQADTVTILAANGSIASQIRFQTADILMKCQSHPQFKSIRQIHCKVIPSFAYAANPTSNKVNLKKNLSPLSPTTAATLQEIAQTIEDEKLREVLLRISTHVSE